MNKAKISKQHSGTPLFFCITRLKSLLLLAVMSLSLAALDSKGAMEIKVFDYETTESARLAWIPSIYSPEVGLFPGNAEGEKNGVIFPCSYTDAAIRCFWDMDVNLDLSAYEIFTLRLFVEDPAPIASLTLYFRSPGGWYAGSNGIVNPGWQTLRFQKKYFNIEGTPAGWDQIEGIRFSPWKSENGETSIIATELTAYTPPIIIIKGTRNYDLSSAETYANLLASHLDFFEIEYLMMTDEEATEGISREAKIVFLPYNNNLSEQEITNIENHVASGGKLIAFYTLPDRLRDELGINVIRWKQIDLKGMKFIPGIMECVPDYAYQASWNIFEVEPASSQTRILAYWEDKSGQILDDPAWLVNENGAYMSHVLHDDDIEQKRRIVMALCYHFMPELGFAVIQAAIDNIGKIGPYHGFEEAVDGIKADALLTPRAALVEDYISSATVLRNRAIDMKTSSTVCEGYNAAEQARYYLLEAFYLAQHPKLPEFRAVWNHSGTGAWPGDWERSAINLEANGFNTVLPNMLWGGLAHYDSVYLPHSDIFNQYGDQISSCIAACHAHGIEVHVWKVNWNLLNAPKSFIEAMRAEGRTQVDVNGEPVDWLCPSDIRNYELELNTMLEVATKYDVDGIHFDYIRYPNSYTCYCDGCRARFEQHIGATVTNWPEDCYSGPLKEQYQSWRCEQITRLVAGVYQAVKSVRPDCKISVAAFSNYPSCKYSVGQDWLYWVKQGYIDFICPMDYTTSLTGFRSHVETQLDLVGGKIPLYPGVGCFINPPDQSLAQLCITRELNTGGFVLFNYAESLATTELPVLRKGFTSTFFPYNFFISY